MDSLIGELIKKMGLYDEPDILNKTKELLRLLELRAINVPLQVNEYGKIVLCADIAACLIGIAFDKEQSLKLSGMRKSQYAKDKRMIEKLLDVNKVVGVNDICIQLGLDEVAKKSNELLELYKKTVAREQADVDVTHPQYAAMAVFYGCKLIKGRAPKTKLMPFSNLRPSQWMQLEQHWDKFMTKNYKDTLDNKLVRTDVLQGVATDNPTEPNNACPKDKSKPETEEYDAWKSRMLRTAEARLRHEQESNRTEKENIMLVT